MDIKITKAQYHPYPLLGFPLPFLWSPLASALRCYKSIVYNFSQINSLINGIYFYAVSTQNGVFSVEFLSNLGDEKGLERTNCVEIGVGE